MAADLQFAIRAVNEASSALNAVKGDLESVGQSADGATGGLSNAGKGIDSAGSAAEKGHGPLSKLASAFGDVAKIAGGIVIAQGLLKLPGLLMGMADAASDMNENMSKAQTIFGDSFGAIEQFADDAAQAVGLSKSEALSATGTFGNMFTQLGIGKGKAAEMSMSMVTLAGDFASFHNADITDVIQAQTAAFRGEYDSLQRFVPTINAAAVETEALRETGKKFAKDLTDQDKALATSTLMFKGAGDAVGDFSRTKDGDANKTRILKAEYANLSAELGEKLLPIQIAIKQAMLDAIPVFKEVGKFLAPIAAFAFDGLKTLAGLVWDGIRDLAEKYGPKLIELAGLAWDGLTAVAGLAWDGLRAVGGLVWDGLKEAWSVAGPILGTVAGLAWDGITALAGLVWDSLKDAWNAAGPYMKDIAKLTWDGLKELAGVSWSAMKDAWEKMGPKITDAAEASARFVQTLSGMEKAAGGLALIGPGFAGIVLAAKGLDMVGINFDSIKGAIQGIGDALGPLGSLWKGFIEDDLKEGGKQAKEVALAFGPLIDAFRDLGSQLQPLQPLLGPAVTVLAVLTALPFVPLAAGITLVLGGLKFLIQYIGQTAQGSIDTFTASVDLLNKAIDLFKQYLGPALASALQTIVNLSTDIINAFKPAGTWLVAAGSAIVDGIIKGVSNAAPALMSKMRSLASDALDAAKDFLKIKSPSVAFADQVGVPIAQGVAEGFGIEWPNTIGNIQNTMGISLDQLNRDLAAWESDFLATAARNARIEIGGAYNVGQMFGSSATEGHYNPALFGGFGGGIPVLQGGGSVAAPLPAYSGPTNNAGSSGRWGDFNNGMTVIIQGPVNGVDDLLKTLDTAARRMGYSGVLTP